MSEQRTFDEHLNQARSRSGDPDTARRAAAELRESRKARTLAVRVWQYLYDFGPTTTADLADIMDERRDVISPRMVTLEAAGLAERESVEGRRIVWRAVRSNDPRAALREQRKRQAASGFDARLAEFDSRLRLAGYSQPGELSFDQIVELARQVFKPRRNPKP